MESVMDGASFQRLATPGVAAIQRGFTLDAFAAAGEAKLRSRGVGFENTKRLGEYLENNTLEVHVVVTAAVNAQLVPSSLLISLRAFATHQYHHQEDPIWECP
jgi:hypothetical protein